MYENEGMQFFPDVLKRQAVESINAKPKFIKRLTVLSLVYQLLYITQKN